MNKRTKKTFLLTALGTGCLVTLSWAAQGERQDDRRTTTELRTAQGAGDTELDQMRRRLQDTAKSRVEQAAREQNVRIEDQKLMISILRGGMIAAAPGSDTGGALDPGQPDRPGIQDRGAEDRRTQDRGAEDRGAQDRGAGQRIGEGMDEAGAASESRYVEGLVVVTGDLGAGATGIGAARTGTGTGAGGESGDVYKILIEPGTNKVKLQSVQGGRSMEFPLVQLSEAGRFETEPIEAGARRPQPIGERDRGDDEKQDRGAAAEQGDTRRIGQTGLSDVGSPDWPTIYASVVCGLAKQN